MIDDPSTLSKWERLKYELLLPIPVVVVLALLLVWSFAGLFLRLP
jgi:hypothetical protein